MAKNKDAQLIVRINKAQRDEFVALCNELDTSSSKEIRKFIKRFVNKHKPKQKALKGDQNGEKSRSETT
ncbi:hypothetical protein [Pseudoalteromonas luteoviolacea]|uniref:CopG family transcriptional regulator n=1 Tax=Pseudoalteromonas luteoviolacea H33 TaxID=1365251 RepID=A0A167A6T8_9GAMM|nr:hypothetical protein [Pseudoalteromonas luteoviolacea]KZN45046.1 hypothetical protein N476_25680 [Pseudoalteromonas luteoviolacea H33]KZN79280.1 hypothetical protein N477_00335 [Pseudoalteromonas luteoviolacea H33-S]MBQ4877920.1 hypothetical protein [Pseudoalteromonas luteoviolacea]MBQ4906955.1 hypothetical protein [Pseudoalteromonas luteoviolacea]